MTDIPTATPTRSYRALLLYGLCTCVCMVVILLVLGMYFTSAPTHDATEKRITIPEGASATTVSRLLAQAEIIRSPFIFSLYIRLLGAEAKLLPGIYVFQEPQSAYEVARSFLGANHRTPPIKVTIPEGATLADFDRIISDAHPTIAAGEILAAAQHKEGVLFPDTYLLSEGDTAADITLLLTRTYEEKLQPLEADIATSGLSREDVIILASLIEKEGKSEESMRIISGILRKRLAIDMPLQVDATYAYALGKTSAELTEEELRADSPWNTYSKKGLPPSPIGSPGLKAIDAVLHPIETEYLYYLSDSDDVFHFATTFDEHKRNKALYLRD